jgi:hypothetical protein
VGKSHIAQALGGQLIKAGYTVFYRSIFDAVRDLLHEEAFDGHEKVMARYLIPYAAKSETFSNSWKFNVMSVASCVAWRVGSSWMVSWMAA